MRKNLETLGSGPLRGVRVVEFAGLGPAPFACMMLSDMGADVVTVERAGKPLGGARNIAGRGRRVAQTDLKDAAQRQRVVELVRHADVLVEGFRPGVMERLGLGPGEMHAANPGLVYARMTGWGQHGPLAQTAGHDINYIGLSGALHAIGPKGGAPVPPLNLVGDYGGGSLYLVAGILAALVERGRSGLGQVVDAAITDGTLSLMTQYFSAAARGQFVEDRGSNLLDGGAPYYGTYETSDRRHVCVGPIEPTFFAELIDRLGLDAAFRDAQGDRSRWEDLRAAMAAAFRQRARDEWAWLFEATDACVTPVLSLSEAQEHPHHLARQAVIDVQGVRQPAPAPRFSRTPSRVQGPAPEEATALDALLARWSGAMEVTP